jgi:threonine dehydratase
VIFARPAGRRFSRDCSVGAKSPSANEPKMITLSDIEAAQERVTSSIYATPLISSHALSVISGAEVYLKLENLQKTGSFKVRGAFNKMANVPEQRVIGASMGNHAQAVAYAASALGKHAVIVMPRNASLVKQEATKGYGADVVLHGDRFSDALAHALAQKDARFIHPFDDDDVIAGQGTVGLEIVEELRDIDAILVPVGGGGLIAGVATAVKERSPRTEVVGVQTESAISACRSFRERHLCTVEPSTTIADGIAVGTVGTRTLDVMERRVDDVLAVGEDSIARAILLFLERKKLVVEGAGAVPLAALLEQPDRFRGKRVVLVVSGGNIDFTVVDRIILKGLATSGRIGMMNVVLDDVAGSLHAITGVIAASGANVLSVKHDRLAAGVPIGRTKVVFTVEVRGREHLEEVFKALRDRSYELGADR